MTNGLHIDPGGQPPFNQNFTINKHHLNIAPLPRVNQSAEGVHMRPPVRTPDVEHHQISLLANRQAANLRLLPQSPRAAHRGHLEHMMGLPLVTHEPLLNTRSRKRPAHQLHHISVLGIGCERNVHACPFEGRRRRKSPRGGVALGNVNGMSTGTRKPLDVGGRHINAVTAHQSMVEKADFLQHLGRGSPGARLYPLDLNFALAQVCGDDHIMRLGRARHLAKKIIRAGIDCMRSKVHLNARMIAPARHQIKPSLQRSGPYGRVVMPVALRHAGKVNVMNAPTWTKTQTKFGDGIGRHIRMNKVVAHDRAAREKRLKRPKPRQSTGLLHIDLSAFGDSRCVRGSKPQIGGHASNHDQNGVQMRVDEAGYDQPITERQASTCFEALWGARSKPGDPPALNANTATAQQRLRRFPREDDGVPDEEVEGVQGRKSHEVCSPRRGPRLYMLQAFCNCKDMNFIQTPEQLRTLFAEPSSNALRKESDHLHPIYQQWIQASGFAVLATSGPNGLDTSPRGDPVPLVKVINNKTLVLPERKGNNRIDSLLNILHDPRVSLIFLVPGVDETLRVNGSARITADPELMQSLAVNNRPPTCALWIHVEQAFFQCAKSIMRSGLWQQRAANMPEPPSAGAMLAALSEGAINPTEYDQEKPQRLRDGMY